MQISTKQWKIKHDYIGVTLQYEFSKASITFLIEAKPAVDSFTLGQGKK